LKRRALPRIKPIGFVLLSTVLTAACGESEHSQQGRSEADDLAHNLRIIDTHIDVPYRLEKHPEDVSVATKSGDFDYPRARQGGLNVAFMSIYIPAAVDRDGKGTALAERLIDGVRSLAFRAPYKFGLATCRADVVENDALNRVSLAMGMENGGPLASAADAPEHFYHRGIRYVTLAHSTWNALSDSSYDPDEHWQGLSPTGKEMVARLNRLGVMVDVSHISDKAFWQVLALTQVPVIASHSSARHFTPGFQRNLADDMIRALGANGGVVQINVGSGFLTRQARDYSDAMKQARESYLAERSLDPGSPEAADFNQRYRETHPYPYASIADVVDHIDHVVALAGIEHVGIGTDFDGVGDTLPVGLKSVADYPNLIQGLLGRGYDAKAIEAILGGNLMRVWAANEAFATESGQRPECASS